MSQVTIPKEVFDSQIDIMRSEYIREYGGEALSDEMRSFSRTQTVARYRAMMHFWQSRLEPARPGMSIEDVARHAICSNGIEQASRALKAFGIQTDSP